MDYINWANASPSIPDTQDYFEFRHLRLVADGAGYGVYDFRLQFTLEPETVGTSPAGTVASPDVKDAYFTLNEVPRLGRIRIGNFFVPFSLERSIPTQGVFAANREVGVAAYNATDDQNLSWAYGIFFDSISEGLKERMDDNQGGSPQRTAQLGALLRRAIRRALPGAHRGGNTLLARPVRSREVRISSADPRRPPDH
jgi:phosphate-selective porin OprO/OprP